MTSIVETFIRETELIRDMDYQLTNIFDKRNQQPVLIVGLSRGGLVAGVTLSHTYDAPFHPLVWSTRDHARTDTSSLEYVAKKSRDGLVVIVDDICDTGKSFKDIAYALATTKQGELFDGIGYVAGRGANLNNIVYAALYQRATSEFKSEVVGEIVEGEEWIEFSWELAGQAVMAGNPLT